MRITLLFPVVLAAVLMAFPCVLWAVCTDFDPAQTVEACQQNCQAAGCDEPSKVEDGHSCSSACQHLHEPPIQPAE